MQQQAATAAAAAAPHLHLRLRLCVALRHGPGVHQEDHDVLSVGGRAAAAALGALVVHLAEGKPLGDGGARGQRQAD